jgi:ACS family hexuronate transporter-like MFS transporter
VTAAPAPARWVIVGLILIAQAVSNVGPLGIPAIASLIRDDLNLSLAQAGSFLSAYYIGPILASLPAGTLTDRWGIKRMLVLGQAIIAIGLVAVSASLTYAAFITLMAVAGLGYGILNPASTKAVIAWAPPAQRATLVGFKQVGLPFGGVMGAALLPPLALMLGWRWAVIGSALIIASAAVATVTIYRDPPQSPALTVETGARSPVSTVLRNRNLWLLAGCTLVFAAMQTVWMSYLVLYLQGVVGLSLIAASGYLALAQFGGMVGRISFGVLSDRAFGGNRRLPLAIAGLGSTLCSVAIAATGPGTSVLWLTTLAVVFGFVGIGWNGVQLTLLAEIAGPRAAGTAVGLGLAISSAGVTLGPPTFGYFVTLSGSYTAPWLALAAVMLAALGVLTFVREGPALRGA